MTIRREVDWFGIYVKGSTPIDDIPEVLRDMHPFFGGAGDQYLQVSVVQPRSITYSAGVYEYFEDGFGVLPRTRTKTGTEIPIEGFSSIRSWFGLKIRYRYHDDGPKITVIPTKSE